MSVKLYDISNWCKQGDNIEDYPYIGEIDTSFDLGEVVKIGDDYYVPGIVGGDRKNAGVRRVEVNLNPGSKEYESELACPYCGYKEDTSWELSDDEDEHECGRCGAIMSYQRVVTVEYNSAPVRPPDIVKARWV